MFAKPGQIHRLLVSLLVIQIERKPEEGLTLTVQLTRLLSVSVLAIQIWACYQNELHVFSLQDCPFISFVYQFLLGAEKNDGF